MNKNANSDIWTLPEYKLRDILASDAPVLRRSAARWALIIRFGAQDVHLPAPLALGNAAEV